MIISNLRLYNFRNYEQLNIDFSNNLNIIYGNNGTGKSNLIEAIYLLSLSKSFRTMNDKNLIRKNSDVKTICVPNTIDKTDVVNPNGNILIDDFSENLLNWKEKGGISVKFTDKEDERFVCTSSLDICLQDNLERNLIRKEF